jgi:hypothetical protein
MHRVARVICLSLGLVVATSGSAGAATLAPTSANFGNQAVGSVSAPRAFTLTPDVVDLLPLTITTTGDFKQTNNCPAALQFLTGACTINVTFGPTAAGDRVGTLSTTTLVVGGPTAALRGTGGGGTTQDGKGGIAGKKCKKKGKKKKGKGKKRAAAAKKKKGKKGKKCKKKKKKGKGKKKR